MFWVVLGVASWLTGTFPVFILLVVIRIFWKAYREVVNQQIVIEEPEPQVFPVFIYHEVHHYHHHQSHSSFYVDQK